MDQADIFGYLGGSLTTLAFVPQCVKVWRTRSTKDISLAMYVVFTTGVACWAWYGYLMNALPILGTNIFTLLLASCILITKIRNAPYEREIQGKNPNPMPPSVIQGPS
jgi:MtN3 and saliva related transmembrane protein